MARDRQRAKQRRRRQQGTGQPGRARRDRDASAREMGLDDAGVDEAGLGEPAPDVDPAGSSVFPSLDHASGFADEARLAEAGLPLPPEDAEGVEDEGAYEPAPHQIEGAPVAPR